MTYTSIYGPIKSRGGLERAVLTTLKMWLVPYIAEVERQEGLLSRSTPTPPDAGSYRGGVDFETWRQEWCPMMIVTCTPNDTAERENGGIYGENYAVGVAAIFVGETEDEVRRIIDIYGAAMMGALTEQGGMQGYVQKTVLVNPPHIEFPANPQGGVNRLAARTVMTLNCFVDSIVDESQGPRTPPVDPYADPAAWPTTEDVVVDLLTVSPDDYQSPQTGQSVVYEQVIVEE